MRTLVLGGARSGKSGIAESLVGDGDCVYVATARPFDQAFDADFQARIARHVERRPSHWRTEDKTDLCECLSQHASGTMLVDDLATWLTARIDAAQGWDDPRALLAGLEQELVQALDAATGDVIIVSAEVGMSIVPEHPSARAFRDCLGTLNQAVAEVCEEVLLVVAGQKLKLKPA
ncbi:bifunctional adenosylcobinamide kinase/adenosylcobinamide-phosphate guanylyltransferase [Corynebacterium pelargi]|uniref:Adenosylcobinamide kinase n=1 Tax=Corynebacterium pelargi TaxID=1471400 RepID=A0A410W7S7_9CORY|nr:bifunctional adenosylcobinamide kinase/adenosylcobinamide-phosphate guanylyltransferase [Corynebacterium pelargi]QAU52003.1 Bifunctional adenosylcobalamin biosynthesis protein CobU [Corynebacterium pelargi]GGG70874.1 adenosylcobinamide kinase/adenosylcobinamide phosphate guanyltransferase [Corynebacterium pelargi]